jgi:hypothetical protein
MDYMYTFKQAHNDRLENAGVKTYRPNDGFRVLTPKTPSPKHLLKQANKSVRVALATITNLLVR